ncbi:hypothetical protein LJC58_10425 [Lachnospiraceae bacterium OttesenSCG-928-D06]|nr:hypothetical protein [Lachnospiraceae bacterium OttesenSCG-928-D06]
MKYEKIGFCITIDFENEYLVRANILKMKEESMYEFTLELMRKDIGLYMPINNDTVYQLESKRVNADVTNVIEKYFIDDYFTQFVNKYEELVMFLSLGTSLTETYPSLREVPYV